MGKRNDNIKLIRLTDKWNNKKIWIIKHYPDGHYAINQEIDGRKFYSHFQRVKKKKK